MIDLLASRHHMRWLKLCTDNLPGDVKAWETDFRDRLGGFSVVGWRAKIIADPGDAEERIITLNNCRLCKKCSKTPTPPDRFYGEGIRGQAWNAHTGPRETPYACGMTTSGAHYHWLSLEWRDSGP